MIHRHPVMQTHIFSLLPYSSFTRRPGSSGDLIGKRKLAGMKKRRGNHTERHLQQRKKKKKTGFISKVWGRREGEKDPDLLFFC